ncbi:MAG: Uma2 family endonuclease [Chloroflexota bacterium]|nr:Uma2 family endonuclease [Chloroflexota bacterium]
MLAPALTPREIAAVLTEDARLHRFTVETFLGMMASGVFAKNERVELLEGWVVEKMAVNPAHVSVQRRLTAWLNRVVTAGWFADKEQPIILLNSLPIADVAVMRGEWNDYDHRHPEAFDIGLVIEVLDSTVASDRKNKCALYAAAGVARMWLVSVPDRTIEVGSNPNQDEKCYDSLVTYSADQHVPLVIDGVTIASIRVADVLPGVT